jgi:hypothetical protein
MEGTRSGQKGARVVSTLGVRQAAIEGRFRGITTHQLCLAWWLHLAGHITRRQLRVYFAAHEMDERRRYTGTADRKQQGGRIARRPLFEIDEIKTLVGGRGSDAADAELASDVRTLKRLGLVTIDPHVIHFATSVDQINLDDVAGFWSMFTQIPNQGRSVPVPRRTLRALAAGFSRGVTGVMIALMIRSLFWHRESEDYRVDGRTKGSWIADVFGLSRRAITDARTHLIALGWLAPIETKQWQLNRWGSHDRINVEWTVGREGQGGEFASPPAGFSGEFASPDLNQSSSPTEKELKTRSPGRRPDRPGVSLNGISGKKQGDKAPAVPSLHNIEAVHLSDTSSLLTLYDQAVRKNLIRNSEAGQLDFIALAERARVRGHNPGGMFRWLLTRKRFDFITQADEDAAVQRLREWRYGKAERSSYRGENSPPPPVKNPELSDDDKIVLGCLKVAEDRGLDPFFVVRRIGVEWTRDRWDAALQAYEERDIARRMGT